MKLRIFVNPSRLRRWHLTLAHRLGGAGHHVSFAFAEGGPTLPAVLNVVMAIERRLYRLPEQHPSQKLDFVDLASLTADMQHPELILDLTVKGVDASAMACPVIGLFFDGRRGEEAAIVATLGARRTVLTATDERGCVVVEARPAIETTQVLSQALDDVFTRAITVLVKAVGAPPPGGTRPLSYPSQAGTAGAAAITASGLTAFALTAFLRRAKRKLGLGGIGLAGARAPHWHVGWRQAGGRDIALLDRPSWQKDDYRWLQDDGRRYYADPFLFEHAGASHLFCEEMPLTSAKGVIAHFVIDAAGVPGLPRTVLERPYHLSYPFVFEWDEAVWMIPESSTSRRIELYRAVRFPDHWVLDAVLVDDVAASDATFFAHAGKLWLFATDQDGGLSWDTLCIWHATSLQGPWTPHRANPVLIDAGSARPAGRIIERDGRLLRPAQDCTAGYGGGLVLKEITHLDEDRFEERLFDAGRTMVGVHTLNTGSGFEAIDLLGVPMERGSR